MANKDANDSRGKSDSQTTGKSEDALKKAAAVTAASEGGDESRSAKTPVSAELLRAFVQVASEPLLIVKMSGWEIELASSAAIDLLSGEAGGLVGTSVADLFARMDEQTRLATRIANHGKADGVVTELRRAGEGERFAVRISARAVGGTAIMSVAPIRRRAESGLHPGMRDPLTGIYNREYFARVAHHEFERARRYERTLSVARIEIDNFDIVVANHTAAVGDALLKGVAQRCQACVRDVDIVARFGDIELVVLLPETGLAGAKQMFERMRATIADGRYAGVKLEITASIGVSEMLPTDDGISDVLTRADKAVERAVNAGRNSVKVA